MVNDNTVRYIRGSIKDIKNSKYVLPSSSIIYVVNDYRVVVLLLMGDGQHTLSELYYRSKWYRRLLNKIKKLFRRVS